MHVSRVDPVVIRDVTAHDTSGLSRVSCIVDDTPVWFESADEALQPSATAFCTAFLIPALSMGRQLQVDGAVSPLWQAQSETLVEVLREWWNLPRLLPLIATSEAATDPGTRTALCFTCGVDSFHSLLAGPYPVDALITAHGYDVPLEDTPRWDALCRSLDEVSTRRSVAPIRIRTNLRQHPLFATSKWERTHGGALAALGHLVGDVRRLLISASYPYSMPTPWGSSWRIDELFSSDRLHVCHVGAGLFRRQKLRSIAGDALVQGHLRVCWENRSDTGNCSVCEKCLRTMLSLSALGRLQEFHVFDASRLVPGLGALKTLTPEQRVVYAALAESQPDHDIRSAVRGMLDRTLSRPDDRQSLRARLMRGMRAARKRLF